MPSLRLSQNDKRILNGLSDGDLGTGRWVDYHTLEKFGMVSIRHEPGTWTMVITDAGKDALDAALREAKPLPVVAAGPTVAAKKVQP